jgi:anaerobic magnesium-protoporphyrin IX monomethyl ester cyclase
MTPTPEVLLIFPPYWDAGMPYLSLPVLASYLQMRGLRVQTADLNLACTRWLLSPAQMEASLARAAKIAACGGNRSPEDDEAFRDNLEVCQAAWQAAGPGLVTPFQAGAELPRRVDDYTAFLRRLQWSFRVASAPFFPLTITPTGLESGSLLSRLSHVADFVERERPIPAGRQIAAFAAEHAPRGIPVVGLSVTGPSQLLPALQLARDFKRLAPDTFICVGGAEIPYLRDALRACMLPFRWVDAFVAGEGELVLADLALATRSGRDPRAVQGLILVNDGRVEHTGLQAMVPLQDLAAPDFSGFSPRDYLANDDAIALTFARGCSWGRCAFCTQSSSYSAYRAMPPAQVASHLEAVSRQVPIKSIILNDENVTTARLREFGKTVQELLPGRRWFALARLARPLASPRFARELAESGCAMLSLGLESADGRVLDLNRKGIAVRDVPDILRSLHTAGIWVHLFVIFGLPGETPESASHTLRFVAEHRAFIDSLSAATFRLERGSIIASKPEDFGLTRLPVPDDHCDLKLPFTGNEWLSEEQAGECFDRMLAALLGTPQCPIELNQLRGQYVLQLISSGGIEGMRGAMARRAHETALARSMLERDDATLARFHATPLGACLRAAGQGSRALLLDPERSLFGILDERTAAFLRLRSLGLPLDLIKELQPESDSENLVLYLLATRLLQDSGGIDAP